MNMRDSRDDDPDDDGGGGLVRDGATQTGRAVILIVVAIVVAVVLLHHHEPSAVNASSTSKASSSTTEASSATTVPPHATTTAPTTTPPSTVPVANVKVLVLNGASFAQPYASEFTAKLKTLGYNTLTPNNASGTVTKTAIYVLTQGFAPEAQALASSLGLPPTAVQTNVPSGPPLSSGISGTGANLVLVVGPDLAAQATSGSSGASSSPGTTAAPGNNTSSPATTAAPGA